MITFDYTRWTLRLEGACTRCLSAIPKSLFLPFAQPRKALTAALRPAGSEGDYPKRDFNIALPKQVRFWLTVGAPHAKIQHERPPLAGGMFNVICNSLGETAIRDQKARINRRIRVPQVRLIGEEGEQLGIMPTFQALEMAEERGLDLVEVAPNAEPPVCKLMDYGKFLYDQQKKDREARKNQKTVDIKGIQLSPNSGEHYIDVKLHQAREFLQDGDKVKFTVRFRGRQLAHTDIGMKMLNDIAESLRDIALVEQRPLPEGRTYTLLVAPAPIKAPKRERPAPSANVSEPAPTEG